MIWRSVWFGVRVCLDLACTLDTDSNKILLATTYTGNQKNWTRAAYKPLLSRTLPKTIGQMRWQRMFWVAIVVFDWWLVSEVMVGLRYDHHYHTICYDAQAYLAMCVWARWVGPCPNKELYKKTKIINLASKFTFLVDPNLVELGWQTCRSSSIFSEPSGTELYGLRSHIGDRIFSVQSVSYQYLHLNI